MDDDKTEWQMSVESDRRLAYLAGFFDGEGSVSIAYRKAPTAPGARTPQYVLVVAVTQIDTRPLVMFQETFGGRIHSQGKHRRPCYAWITAANKAVAPLQALLPYLVVKRQDAEIGLAFQAKNRRLKPGTAPSAESLAEREEFRRKLVHLHGRAATSTNRTKLQDAAEQAG